MRIGIVALVVLGAAAGLWWWLGQDADPSPDTSVLDVDVEPADENGPALEGTGLQRADTPTAGADLHGPGRVTGVVTDTSGQALAGLPVHLHGSTTVNAMPWLTAARMRTAQQPPNMSRRPMASTTTDADGAFHFVGLRMQHSYQVRVPASEGRTSAGASVWLHEPHQQVRLTVYPGVPLRVRAVDADGRGIAAWVRAHMQAPGQSTGNHTWSLPQQPTDADGLLALPGVPRGTLTFFVFLPGRGSRSGIQVDAPHEGTALLPFEPQGGATLAGTLADTKGQPVADANLLIWVNPGGPQDWAHRSERVVKSGADGTYRFEHLPAGYLTSLNVLAPGYLDHAQSGSNDKLDEGQTLVRDVTLHRGGRIRGRVLDEAGTPVPDMLVSSAQLRGGFYPGQGETARSDAEGRFLLETVRLGPGRLAAWGATHYTPSGDRSHGHWNAHAAGSPYELKTEGEEIELDLTVAPAGRLAGRVITDEGMGVSGAHITVRGQMAQAVNRFDRYGLQATSDPQGAFEVVGLPPGSWTLLAKTGDRVSETIAFDTRAGEATPLTITLRPTATVRGRVLVAGEPPSFPLEVQIAPVPNDGNGIQRSAKTDAKGAFEIDGLPAGNVEAYVHALWGQFQGERTALTLDWGEVKSDVIVQCEALRVLRGIVVDAEGKPKGGLSLRLDYGRGSIGGTTSIDGRFEWIGLPDEKFMLTLGKMPPMPVDASEEDLRLTYEAQEGLVIEGTVLTPEGKPVPRGTLLVWVVGPGGGMSGRGVQISNGRFRHEGSAGPGTIRITLSEATDAAGGPIGARPFSLDDYKPDGEPLVIQLEAGLSIAGRVVDAEGAGVMGVQVTAHERRTPGSGRRLHHHRNAPQAVSDAEGHFQLEGCGESDYQVTCAPGDRWVQPAPQTVKAGSSSLTFTLHAGADLTGVALDKDDQPATGLSVRFQWDQGDSQASRQAMTDREGRFTITGLPAATDGHLSAYPQGDDAPWLRLHHVEARSDAKDVVLRIERGVFIEGTVTGPDGEAVPDVHVRGESKSGSDRRTSQHAWVQRGSRAFRLGPIRAGTWTLTAQAGGAYAAGEPVEVRAPATDVKLQVRRGYPIQGQLTGEDLQGFRVAWAYAHGGGGQSRSMHSVSAAGSFVLPNDKPYEGSLFIHKEGDRRYILLEDITAGQPLPPLTWKTGHTIRGRVTGLDQIEERWRTYLRRVTAKHDELPVHAQANLREDGSFELTGLPEGTYTVSASAGAWSATVGRAKTGTDDVVLEIKKREGRR